MSGQLPLILPVREAHGEGDHPKDGGGVEAETGMQAMSKRFHEEGGELYLPAAE
jgi:hypothetical protein